MPMFGPHNRRFYLILILLIEFFRESKTFMKFLSRTKNVLKQSWWLKFPNNQSAIFQTYHCYLNPLDIHRNATYIKIPQFNLPLLSRWTQIVHKQNFLFRDYSQFLILFIETYDAKLGDKLLNDHSHTGLALSSQLRILRVQSS